MKSPSRRPPRSSSTSTPAKYEPVPIRIGKDGRWALTGDVPTACRPRTSISQADERRPCSRSSRRRHSRASRIDVVFPVLHGPYGEDGTVQGLLELANVPYVGAGVLGSAVGMDKAVMKTLFAAHGLPIVPHLTVMRRDWQCDPGQSPRAWRTSFATRSSSSRRTSDRASASPRPRTTRASRGDGAGAAVRQEDRHRVRRGQCARDRMRRARQRRPRGVGSGRDHRDPPRRLLFATPPSTSTRTARRRRFRPICRRR